MAYHDTGGLRDQLFLMPVSMRDWLAEGHLPWFIIEVVERIDTAGLHVRHRNDGVGRPAYDPDMMLALLFYAYAGGSRSSRRIEASCRTDAAYRVICGDVVPDHATIARFLVNHSQTRSVSSSSPCCACVRRQGWCRWARSRSMGPRSAPMPRWTATTQATGSGARSRRSWPRPSRSTPTSTPSPGCSTSSRSERLDSRSKDKLTGLLKAGDPTGEVTTAWHADRRLSAGAVRPHRRRPRARLGRSALSRHARP
jgi:hypothetical protein